MASKTPQALLATDLDGTLLRRDGSISERTREALAAAVESPVEVVFVTGRPLTMLGEVLAATGHAGTVIGANGALLLDATTGVPSRVTPFAPDDLEELWGNLVTAFPTGEYLSMMWHPAGSSERFDGRGSDYMATIRQRIADGWQFYKLLVMGPAEHTPDSIVPATQEAVGAKAEVTHSSTRMPLVELTPAGVTKGSALADYALAREMPLAAVHAIGDMPNDLPMLAVAGTSYAPANAHELVHTAADIVVGSNEADGVAQLLEDLLARHA